VAIAGALAAAMIMPRRGDETGVVDAVPERQPAAGQKSAAATEVTSTVSD
jgi:hypothetical protein